METARKPTVRCLCCGRRRPGGRGALRELAAAECPSCGYLGWAEAADPSIRAWGDARQRSRLRRIA